MHLLIPHGLSYLNSVGLNINFAVCVRVCMSVCVGEFHLAARPPGLRLETRGLPSLSVPPEMVRPSVLPSFLISSTSVTPRSSSAQKHKSHTHSPCQD